MLSSTTPKRQLNVVITGGSRGFGKSLVKTFVKDGHNVIFTSRSEQNIMKLMHELPDEHLRKQKIVGMIADVSCYDDLENLEWSIDRHMKHGVVDVWINNAAISDGNTPFVKTSRGKIKEIIDTNLYGSAIATQKAVDISAKSHPRHARMMHIFNVAGSGSDGSTTEDYSIYGASKAGVAQLTRTLQKEMAHDRGVGIHLISPGMMPTDLLAENVCERKRAIYNILCEDPDVVAACLLPMIKSVVNNNKKAEFLRFLTFWRIVYRLLSAHGRQDRFF